jgi:hypothetical protein
MPQISKTENYSTEFKKGIASQLITEPQTISVTGGGDALKDALISLSGKKLLAQVTIEVGAGDYNGWEVSDAIDIINDDPEKLIIKGLDTRTVVEAGFNGSIYWNVGSVSWDLAADVLTYTSGSPVDFGALGVVAGDIVNLAGGLEDVLSASGNTITLDGAGSYSPYDGEVFYVIPNVRLGEFYVEKGQQFVATFRNMYIEYFETIDESPEDQGLSPVIIVCENCHVDYPEVYYGHVKLNNCNMMNWFLVHNKRTVADFNRCLNETVIEADVGSHINVSEMDITALGSNAIYLYQNCSAKINDVNSYNANRVIQLGAGNDYNFLEGRNINFRYYDTPGSSQIAIELGENSEIHLTQGIDIGGFYTGVKVSKNCEVYIEDGVTASPSNTEDYNITINTRDGNNNVIWVA